MNDQGLGPRSTIVVVPRQMFSETTRSLASILEHSGGRPVVVVDPGSPPALRRHLERLAAAGSIHHLRTGHLLYPNEARALALPLVATPYVVYVDNDVTVSPGWVDALEHCADATGADVVGPIVAIGDDPSRPEPHWVAGPCHIGEVDGQRVLVTKTIERELGLDEARALARTETELVEFHTVLIRCDRLRAVGGFDPGLNTREHCDLCMRVRAQGGSVWVEPASFVVHVLPNRVRRVDRRMWVFRWEQETSLASLSRFRAMWALPDDDRFLTSHAGWIRHNRRLAYPLPRVPARLPGWARRPARAGERLLARATDRAAQRLVIADQRRRRRRHGVPWPTDAPPRRAPVGDERAMA